MKPELEEILGQVLNEHTTNIIAVHDFYKNRNEFYGVLKEEVEEWVEAYEIAVEELSENILPSGVTFMREKYEAEDYIQELENIMYRLGDVVRETFDVMAVFKKLIYQNEVGKL